MAYRQQPYSPRGGRAAASQQGSSRSPSRGGGGSGGGGAAKKKAGRGGGDPLAAVGGDGELHRPASAPPAAHHAFGGYLYHGDYPAQAYYAAPTPSPYHYPIMPPSSPLSHASPYHAPRLYSPPSSSSPPPSRRRSSSSSSSSSSMFVSPSSVTGLEEALDGLALHAAEAQQLPQGPSFSPPPTFEAHGQPINLVLFHGKCPDGIGAAACARSFLGQLAVYRPVFHGAALPAPSIIKDRHILVLDFCFTAAAMEQIKSLAASCLVLDHHSSAYAENGHDRCCYFDLAHSGARLAWDFFYPNQAPPKMIDYIEDRDLWKWSLPNSKEFAVVLDTLPPTVEAYEELLQQTIADPAVIDAMVLRGDAMCVYRDALVNTLTKTAAQREWLGFRVLLVNSPLLQSEIGNALVANNECDIGMVWSYDSQDRSCRVSLRSGKDLSPDLGTIARQFGGGGHVRAAGMKIKSDTIEALFYVPS